MTTDILPAVLRSGQQLSGSGFNTPPLTSAFPHERGVVTPSPWPGLKKFINSPPNTEQQTSNCCAWAHIPRRHARPRLKESLSTVPLVDTFSRETDGSTGMGHILLRLLRSQYRIV